MNVIFPGPDVSPQFGLRHYAELQANYSFWKWFVLLGFEEGEGGAIIEKRNAWILQPPRCRGVEYIRVLSMFELGQIKQS